MPALFRATAVAVLVFVVVAALTRAAGLVVPVVEALVVWFVLNAMANGLRAIPGVGGYLPRPVALLTAALAAFLVGFLVVQSSVRTETVNLLTGGGQGTNHSPARPASAGRSGRPGATA